MHEVEVYGRSAMRDARAEGVPAVDQRPRILLLHGVLSGRVTWGPLRHALGDDVVTLAPDLLGNGGSVAQASAYGLDALVDHLAPVVERFRPTHIIGHSMGGIVSLGLRARMPGAFAGVGIVGLPVYADRATALAYLAARGRVVRGFLHNHRRAHVLCVVAGHAGPAWLRTMERRYPAIPREVLRATFAHNAAAHGPALEDVVFAGAVPALAAIPGSKVALLHGTRDRAAPFDAARDLADASGFDFTVIPEATHQVVFEQPETVARWVREHVLSTASARAESQPAN